MANDCFTSITITGDPGIIKKITDRMDKAFISDKWLGNLLLEIGYSEDDIKTLGVRCRGSVEYRESYDEEIRIDTDTAWVPMLKVFTKFCDRVVGENNYELVYTAEEPGCEIFWTNDPCVEGTWYIDVYGEDVPKGWQDTDPYSWSDAAASKLFSDALKTTEQLTTKEMANKLMYEYEDLSLHQYEYVPLSEVD